MGKSKSIIVNLFQAAKIAEKFILYLLKGKEPQNFYRKYWPHCLFIDKNFDG